MADADGAASPPSTCRPCCAFADLAARRPSARAREEIDALNVYPVPDGDTGTNMFLTFEAARDAAARGGAGGAAGARRPARGAGGATPAGALLGARGNSGVILSQLRRRAAASGSAEAGPGDRSAARLRRGHGAGHRGRLRRRRRAGRGHHPVGRPGRRGRGRRAAADPDAPARARRPRRGRAAAREALARTPDQLPVLRDAGVVDAGGRGLCVVLDAAETAVTGRRPVAARTPRSAPRRIPVRAAADRRPDRRTARPTR